MDALIYDPVQLYTTDCCCPLRVLSDDPDCSLFVPRSSPLCAAGGQLGYTLRQLQLRSTSCYCGNLKPSTPWRPALESASPHLMSAHGAALPQGLHDAPRWHTAVNKHALPGWPTARLFVHAHGDVGNLHKTVVVTSVFDDDFDPACPAAYAAAALLSRRDRLEGAFALITECEHPRILVTTPAIYRLLWARCCVANRPEPPAGLGFVVTLNAVSAFRDLHGLTTQAALAELLRRRESVPQSEAGRIGLTSIANYASKLPMAYRCVEAYARAFGSALVPRGFWVCHGVSQPR